MRRTSRLLFLAAAPLAACTVIVDPSGDTPDPSTFVAGTVTIDDGVGDEPGGPTFVFRYDCAAPPPPVGTGRPVDFTVLQPTDYVDGSAAFTFPQVPPGSCLILNGFVDRDRDFDPFVSIANQVTAGDLGITAVTVQLDTLLLDSTAITPVTNVELEANLLVPLDRPAFTATDARTGELGGAVQIGPEVGTTGNTTLRLSTTPVDSTLTDVENPLFTLVFAADADGNGWPDDNNGNGLPDVVWPRVLFLRLDDADPTGLTTLDPPVVLPGVVLPLDPTDSVNLDTNRVLQSRLAGLPFDGQQVLPVTDITVVVPPLVVTDLAAQTTADLEAVRASGGNVLGQYQILVMNSSGQTWALPNELAAGVPSQASRLSVAEPAEALPARGIVSGSVSLAADPDGPVVLTAFDCASPPPPAGTGSPIDLASIQPSAFDGGIAPFSFDVVPADSCLIITGYIDNDRDFAALYSISQLPTAGDVMLSAEVVQVGSADGGGLVPAVTGVTVTELDSVGLDAPAFTLVSDVTMTRSPSIGATQTVSMTLLASDHDSPMVMAEDPMFTVVFAPDADGNGLPDDNNGDALPDVIWPRVLVVRIDPADPEGLDTLSPPVVLPGIVLPLDPGNPANLAASLVLQSALGGAPFDGQFVTELASLTVAVPGLVVTDLAAQTTAPIESVALSGLDVDGDYAVIVMNASGQTWQLPNESVLFGTEGQGTGFRVEAPAAGDPQFGAIAGTISTADGSDPGGRTILFRFACDAPPPPAGTGSPLDFTILRESAWVDGEVDFRFAGLDASTCQLLTGFIDRDGDWDGLYGTANQATAGDFAMGSLIVNVPAADAATGQVPDVVNQSLVAGLSVPLERPVFTMADVASGGANTPTMTVGNNPGDTAAVYLQLGTSSVSAPVCEATNPLFTLVFREDGDVNGQPDDLNGDGLPDVLWPRVFVRKLDPSDPAGIAVLDPPVVLPGIVVPLDPSDPFNAATNLVIQQAQAGLPFDGLSVFPQAGLTIAVPGLVVTDAATSSVAPIEVVAGSVDVTGEYQILVMNSSGQTWSLPNEAALFSVPGQDDVFVVE